MEVVANLIKAMQEYAEYCNWTDEELVSCLVDDCGLTQQDFIDCGCEDYISVYFGVCISIAALYNKFGDNLPSGNHIRVSYCDSDGFRGGYYYDLYDNCGNLVCMDGETCDMDDIIRDTPDGYIYRFVNRNGEFNTEFYLTKDEMYEAVFFDKNVYHYDC